MIGFRSLLGRVLLIFVVGVAGDLGETSSLAQAAESWANSPDWAQPSSSARNRNIPNNRRRNYEEMRKVTPFSPDSHNVALDVGQVFLMGDLSDRYTDSIGGQLHYTYGVSDLFSFDSALGYSAHKDNSFSMTTLKTGLRVNLSWYDKIIPYATFGLGFYAVDHKVSEGESVSPILFGLHLGPGVNLSVSEQFFVGTSLTFHDIFGTTEFTPSGIPVKVGGTYTTFMLNAGITI